MKNIIIILVLALSVIQIGYSQEKVRLDRIVAVVGSEILLQSELDENIALAKEQAGTLPEGAECFILEQLLSQKILVNQAKLDSLVVTDLEVETQMEARFDRILQMMGGDVSQFEAYYGTTITEAKDKFREDLRDQLLAQRMQGQISSEASITPAEVKAFFNKIPTDSLPYYNSEVEISELIYYPKINATQRQKAKDRATEALNKIKAGADFEEVASTYSQDPGSASRGGNLGFQCRGTFVEEFEAAAYNLEVGEISDLVETEFGFHIIQLLERRGNCLNTRHILVTPSITEEDVTRAYEVLDSVAQLIAKDSMSFEVAVKEFGNDKVQSYNNGGKKINNATNNTFFEIDQLDPDVFFATDTMAVGDVSSPIEFRDARRVRTLMIIQLDSRSEPHRANLLQDYNRIKSFALENKRQEYMMTWIENTIRNTYIRVEEDYQICPSLSRWTDNFE